MSEFIHPEEADYPYGLQLPRGNDYMNIFKRMFIERRAKRIMKRQLEALPACRDDKGRPEPISQAVWRQQRRSINSTVRLLLDEDAWPETDQAAEYPDYDTDYIDNYDYDDQDADEAGRIKRICVRIGVSVLAVGAVIGGNYLVRSVEVASQEPVPSIEQNMDFIMTGSDLSSTTPRDQNSLPGPGEYSLPQAP